MRYIVTIVGERVRPSVDTTDLRYRALADKMRIDYCLPFSVDEIYESWTVYSENFMSPWVNDNKDKVEKVFGIKLREISVK